jgi:hypothetical protein
MPASGSTMTGPMAPGSAGAVVDVVATVVGGATDVDVAGVVADVGGAGGDER